MIGAVCCPNCSRDYAFTSAGLEALFWHLVADHGESHDDAYDLAGSAADECSADDFNDGYGCREWGGE